MSGSGNFFRRLTQSGWWQLWCGLGSPLVCAFFAYRVELAGQEYQAKVAVVARFEQSSSEIVEVGQRFIWALNSEGSLSDAKRAAASFSGRQVVETESLRNSFHVANQIEAYLDALDHFSKQTQDIRAPEDLGKFIGEYNKVITTRKQLSSGIYKSIGLTPS